MVDWKPDVDAGHVIGGAVDLEAGQGGEHDRVQDVVIVSVDLDRRCVRLRAVLLVVVVEIRLAEPTTIHHHLVPGVDLQAVLSEVQEVAAGADRDAHDVVDLHAGGDLRAVEEQGREVDVEVARALRVLARALLADDEEEVAVEVRRGDERAEAELHVGVHLGQHERLGDAVCATKRLSGSGRRRKGSSCTYTRRPPGR